MATDQPQTRPSGPLEIRDVSSRWRPQLRPGGYTYDSQTAIFPYKWEVVPENPLVLRNPGWTKADHLAGRYIAKKHSWMLYTRYGGKEAVKWRLFEQEEQRRFARIKEEHEFKHGIIYPEGGSSPRRLVPPSRLRNLTIRPATVNLFTGKKFVRDSHPSLKWDKLTTGYRLGDAIRAHEFANTSSRKRKAEDLEPDLAA